jgi:acetyltransferase-like isoleucine patch superfamily enzyme
VKKLLKIIFQPLVNLGMIIIFPRFKNRSYYTLRVLLMGMRQKLIGLNKAVPWPVHNSSVVRSPEKIIQGTKAPGISIACYIDGRNGIEIGDNVWIGPRVSIISQNHDLNNYAKYIDTKPIKIGKNCLLTSNCVILPGVEIGEHTVIAANAVVNQSFLEGNQVLAGNPAKVVKQLGKYID